MKILRFRKETHHTVISNLKVGQDWEAVSGQYGGADFVLPYLAELEQQENELALFQPMTSQESNVYLLEIDRMAAELFGMQTIRQTVKKGKQTVTSTAPQSAPVTKKTKGGFKLPFARSKGEF